jgi:hypothetical protein
MKVPQISHEISGKLAKLMIGSLVASLLVLTGQAQGVEVTKDTGTNSGGGGVTIDLNQHPHLRDFVDPSACRYIWARDFQKKFVPRSQNVINQIKASHWYLGDAYEREIDRLKVCMTEGALKEVDVTDRDSVAIFKTGKLNQRQLAVRINEKIYIDMSIFRQMEVPAEKDFAFLHEVTHSFLPLSIPQRNDSLRSFILMLSQDQSAGSLALNIEANHIDMPTTTRDLDQNKNLVLAAVAKNASIEDKMLAALSVPTSALWAPDREKIVNDAKTARFEFSNIEARFFCLSECGANDITSTEVEIIQVYQKNDWKTSTVFTYIDDHNRIVRSSGLSAAIEYRSLEAVKLFVQQLGAPVGPLEMQVLAETMNSSDYKGTFAYISHSRMKIQQMATVVLGSVPAAQLRVLVQDPAVKASPDLTKMISEKLNGK